MTHMIEVTDPKSGAVETILIAGIGSTSTAKRIAKNQFAIAYGADPTRLRTRLVG